eukprot:TRINITY_DN1518_c0_g1_i2.p1 TRINITY_DN1518_c0_g1~~TRINITY_DN1518_c0_g1_i2.p1  ORF type:complete len:322 (+),score=95.34 TRINITY_DN1518_c0_g1_i2:186-1151(+)
MFNNYSKTQRELFLQLNKDLTNLKKTLSQIKLEYLKNSLNSNQNIKNNSIQILSLSVQFEANLKILVNNENENGFVDLFTDISSLDNNSNNHNHNHQISGSTNFVNLFDDQKTTDDLFFDSSIKYKLLSKLQPHYQDLFDDATTTTNNESIIPINKRSIETYNSTNRFTHDLFSDTYDSKFNEQQTDLFSDSFTITSSSTQQTDLFSHNFDLNISPTKKINHKNNNHNIKSKPKKTNEIKKIKTKNQSENNNNLSSKSINTTPINNLNRNDSIPVDTNKTSLSKTKLNSNIKPIITNPTENKSLIKEPLKNNTNKKIKNVT